MKKPVFWWIIVGLTILVAIFDIVCVFAIVINIVKVANAAVLIKNSFFAICLALIILNALLLGLYTVYFVVKKS